MARRPGLRSLADRLGILPDYIDVSGTRRYTSDETREALLAAMGKDASSEAAARRTLAELDRQEHDRLLQPVRVMHPTETQTSLAIRLPERVTRRWDWSVEITGEDGERRHLAGSARGAKRLMMAVPPPTDPGYYDLRIGLEHRAGHWEGTQRLVVAPKSCYRVADRIGSTRSYGVTANLYGLKSERNWGIGDFGDLCQLVRWCGTIGATFVGINPLHALRNRGGEISPYSPVSRLFRNVLYLDVTAVPELADAPTARAQLASASAREELSRLHATARVDYEAVMSLKQSVLDALHREFVKRHRDRGTSRGRAYVRYLARQGDALNDFATFCALEEQFAGEPPVRSDWRRWPAPFRDPRSEAVREFQRTHTDEIDRHRYLQFELDRQLAGAADEAKSAGLTVGLYGDLAIGSASRGSDSWAFPGLFVTGAAVGAPPDDYSATGQDWGLPPIDPARLEHDRYRYWTLLIRNALTHFGALRIDHVMGLFRQFWIPAGRSGRQGAYVRYPARDLLGILALESRRCGAVIVGEDLGTVPRGLPAVLRRWGILSTRVLYFERDRHGGFRPSSRYSKRALVTANTHDHPPLAGFWTGRDLEIRRAAGSIGSQRALRRAERQRASDRAALLARLRAEGILRRGKAPPSAGELCAAVHQFLARTPAPLVGVSLDDLTGETDPVNLPGVGPKQYSSWTRRQRLALEELPGDPGVRQALRGMDERSRIPSPRGADELG